LHILNVYIIIVRKDRDVNEHERLPNIAFRHKVKEQRFYFCSTFYSHSRVFNNDHIPNQERYSLLLMINCVDDFWCQYRIVLPGVIKKKAKGHDSHI
jgi:hypothetical protein